MAYFLLQLKEISACSKVFNSIAIIIIIINGVVSIIVAVGGIISTIL